MTDRWKYLCQFKTTQKSMRVIIDHKIYGSYSFAETFYCGTKINTNYI